MFLQHIGNLPFHKHQPLKLNLKTFMKDVPIYIDYINKFQLYQCIPIIYYFISDNFSINSNELNLDAYVSKSSITYC